MCPKYTYPSIKMLGSSSLILVLGILSSQSANAFNTQSVDFEASSTQYLSISDSEQIGLDGSLNMTVEAWVKFESLPGFDQNFGFVTKSVSAGNNRSYTFYYSGTDKKLRWVNQSDGFNGTDVGVDWIPSLGVWYHIAAIKKESNITFFVNGVQLNSVQVGTSAINNSTAPVRIGAHGNGEAYFDGLIDEVRIWNVARTEGEIAADMNRELVGDEAGLVAYWKLNNSLEDATANGNNLTAVNNPQFSTDTPFTDAEETIDPVIVVPGILGSAQRHDVWIIDPILHTYDDLIATLDENGYTLGEDLFTFGYDWRNSNVATAELLKQKIDEVKGICACAKVDLVAHSMGGLVARQYVQSGDYEDDVDQLIFLGTPHRGAPKAYLMWEGGEFVSPSIVDGLTQRFLKGEARKNGYATVFEYLHNHPISALQQLLPDTNYLFEDDVPRDYPSEYPANTFLETLNAGVDSFLSSGAQIYSFVGTDNSTIVGINVEEAPQKAPLWEHGFPVGFNRAGDRGLILGNGDATVPEPSAGFLAGDETPLTSSHNALPEDASGEIVTLLTDISEPTIVDSWNIPNMKMLLFQLFSPADLLITDPQGKQIGMSGVVETNEIPGAFYTGPDALVEYITIPNPVAGTYTISVRGTGSGSYEVLSSYLTEGETEDLFRVGTTSPAQVTNHQIVLDPNNSDSIRPEVTIQTMLRDLAFAYEQGWVLRSIHTSLSAKLSAALKVRPGIARIAILQNVKKEIERRRSNGINEMGYELLIEDINALLR